MFSQLQFLMKVACYTRTNHKEVMTSTSYSVSKQASVNILVSVVLYLKSCNINYIWLNLILKIIFEVYIDLYFDYKNAPYKIVL